MKKSKFVFAFIIAILFVANIFFEVSIGLNSQKEDNKIHEAYAETLPDEWFYGFCYDDCYPIGIQIVCYPWPSGSCDGTPCTAGWC